MLVRASIQAQLETPGDPADQTASARLPRSIRRDPMPVRMILLRGLSASRLFALGDKAGALSAAQRRSGRRFHLDVRQRVIVKALVSRHAGDASARCQALTKHISYLGRAGAGAAGERPRFFDQRGGEADARLLTQGWGGDRHHFRFIVSPENGDRLSSLEDYTREVMKRVADDLGQPDLAWLATCHFDTDQPHAHVLVRGRRSDGRDLVIPRDYMAYGFRARAQEVAQERLGDLTRAEAERRIWRETQADRFTGFDRRLLAAVDGDGLVDDGVGGRDVWTALTRGRLRHLEALGLAVRTGRRFRLDAQLERKLRGLQLQKDIIRTLHHRRLQSGRSARLLGAERVKGRVVASGHHDELGSVAWVIVRDRAGTEHYARLAFGEAPPRLGRQVGLSAAENGLARLTPGRSHLER